MSVTLSSCAPILVKAVFVGRNGAGAISVPGLQVGDTVLQYQNGNWAGSFDFPAITVADEIQQSSGSDLSAVTFTLFLLRWS